MQTNTKDLNIPNLNEPTMAEKLMHLKEKYLNDIENIIQDSKNPYFEERRKTILNNKIQTQQGKKNSSGTQITDQDAIQIADYLSTNYMEAKQTRYVSITAPLLDIINKLRTKGYYHPRIKRPCANISITQASDPEIINCYSSLIRGLLNYYSPADNFAKVKSVTAALRKGCLFTLARKHKKHKS